MVKRMVAVVFGTSRKTRPTPTTNKIPCQMPETSELAAICDSFSIDSNVIGSIGVRTLLRDRPMLGQWLL